MQVAGLITAGLGTLFSTVSQIQQARGQAESDEAAGKAAVESARQEEFSDRRRSAQIIAKQQAGAAASGLDIDSGTPLELMMDSAFNAELNALKIRKQGEYDKAFYKDRARSSRRAIPGIAFQGLTSLGGMGMAYGAGQSRLKGP